MKTKTSASKGITPTAKGKTPAWKYTKEKESELLYLSLAARIHCGQQQAVLPCELESDEYSEDEEYYNHDTDQEASLPPPGYTIPCKAMTEDDTLRHSIRKRFLDSFAELLARRKVARCVSSCVLVECEKQVFIFVDRNEGINLDGDETDLSPDAVEDHAFLEAFKRHASDLHKCA